MRPHVRLGPDVDEPKIDQRKPRLTPGRHPRILQFVDIRMTPKPRAKEEQEKHRTKDYITVYYIKLCINIRTVLIQAYVQMYRTFMAMETFLHNTLQILAKN